MIIQEGRKGEDVKKPRKQNVRQCNQTGFLHVLPSKATRRVREESENLRAVIKAEMVIPLKMKLQADPMRLTLCYCKLKCYVLTH